MRKLFVLIATLFVLSACAGTTDPTKVAFPDGTEKSLLLIKIDPARVPYALVVSSYDEAERSIGTSFSGMFPLQPGISPAPQYLAKLVDPGTYVFALLVQQDHWAVCFSEQTRSFTVKPGEAVFLGEFNPGPSLGQLTALVTGGGDTSASQYEYYFYFDGILPPQITNPAEHSADFLQAKTYEAVSMPMLHGRLQPVTYKPATFRNGRTLDHTQRRCGGFYLDKMPADDGK